MKPGTRAAGEDRVTGWLRRHAAGAGGERIGDDAAFLPAGGPWAVTVDSQIEGTHFQPGLPLPVIARRLLAVNLSDLAAVGARPRYGLLALAAPPGFAHRTFLRAFVAACRRYRLELVGGDLARGPVISASLTLAGEPVARRWVERRGATPGDGLWLAGTLGESAAGQRLLADGARLEGRAVRLPAGWRRAATRLKTAARRAVRRHLAPTPQLELGAWLAHRARRAAIDLSDGLAKDLARLCSASGVGAVVDPAALPTPAHFVELSDRLDADPLQLALSGGEDYLLLFTLAPRVRPPEKLFPAARKIGVITAEAGLQIERQGTKAVLSPDGWDHLSTPPVSASKD